MPQASAPAQAPAVPNGIGRRRSTQIVLAGAVVAALIGATAAPHTVLHLGYAGVVLGLVAVLALVSLVNLRNPVDDGRLAPQWSLDGLGSLRGWQVTNALPFDREDVDHVVVAPSAVLAVTSRYRGQCPLTRAEGSERDRRDLAAAQRAAHKVRIVLRTQQLREIPVVAVLALWGPGADRRAGGFGTEATVRVVNGNHPEQWAREFAPPKLSIFQRHELSGVFARFVSDQLARRSESAVTTFAAVEAVQPEPLPQVPRNRPILHLVPAPGAAVVPAAAPVAAGAAQARRLAP